MVLFMKMSSRIILFKTLTVLLLTTCTPIVKEPANKTVQYVILKLDDLWFEEGLVHTGWIQVVDFLNKENIRGTIGIIGSSLETDNTAYFNWIKTRHEEGYEIWHHGFCHCRHQEGEVEIREYRGKSLEEQCESILNTHHLAKEKLGITMHSFGAPYNSTDTSTTIALMEIPDIKVWMFKETSIPTDKFLLPRIKEVNIEYPVHVPDYEKFIEGYNQNLAEPILVIQGHPRSWTESEIRFEEFKKIVLFLKNQNVQFITPYEYYQLQLPN